MKTIFYKQEVDDGLVDLINKRCCSSINSSINVSELVKLKDSGFNLSLNSKDVDADLYPLDYILMSTVWNENDDVFTPTETFVSKNTSINKPLNIEHEFERIVGHSVGYEILSEDGKVLQEDGIAIDSLPEKFHLKGKSVIYQIGHTDEQQEKIDKLIIDIKKGKYYISVEALFPNFDYMLKSSNGECKIIERNKTTAFLTKYLRIYNGSGVYDSYKIGRVPRNIIFSGQAIVETPANPNSIIFAKKNNFLSFSKIQTVYSFTESKIKEVKMENDNKDLIAGLQKQIQELNEKNNSLIASVSKVDAEKLKNELEVKVSEVKNLNDEVVKLKANLVEKDSVISNSQKQAEEAVKQLNELKAKLSEIENENRFNLRANLVKEKLQLEIEKSKEIVNTLVSLNDEQFNKYIELQASLTPKVEKKEEVKLETKVEDLQKIEKPNLSTNSLDTKVKDESLDKLSNDMAIFAKSAFKTVAKSKFAQ